MAPSAQISQLSQRLQAAADHENWSEAVSLLNQINLELHQNESRLDKSVLASALQAVQSALSETQRRRDEIATLVRALGGNAARTDEAA